MTSPAPSSPSRHRPPSPHRVPPSRRYDPFLINQSYSLFANRHPRLPWDPASRNPRRPPDNLSLGPTPTGEADQGKANADDAAADLAARLPRGWVAHTHIEPCFSRRVPLPWDEEDRKENEERREVEERRRARRLGIAISGEVAGEEALDEWADEGDDDGSNSNATPRQEPWTKDLVVTFSTSRTSAPQSFRTRICIHPLKPAPHAQHHRVVLKAPAEDPFFHWYHSCNLFSFRTMVNRHGWTLPITSGDPFKSAFQGFAELLKDRVRECISEPKRFHAHVEMSHLESIINLRFTEIVNEYRRVTLLHLEFLPSAWEHVVADISLDYERTRLHYSLLRSALVQSLDLVSRRHPAILLDGGVLDPRRPEQPSSWKEVVRDLLPTTDEEKEDNGRQLTGEERMVRKKMFVLLTQPKDSVLEAPRRPPNRPHLDITSTSLLVRRPTYSSLNPPTLRPARLEFVERVIYRTHLVLAIDFTETHRDELRREVRDRYVKLRDDIDSSRRRLEALRECVRRKNPALMASLGSVPVPRDPGAVGRKSRGLGLQVGGSVDVPVLPAETIDSRAAGGGSGDGKRRGATAGSRRISGGYTLFQTNAVGQSRKILTLFGGSTSARGDDPAALGGMTVLSINDGDGERERGAGGIGGQQSRIPVQPPEGTEGRVEVAAAEDEPGEERWRVGICAYGEAAVAFEDGEGGIAIKGLAGGDEEGIARSEVGEQRALQTGIDAAACRDQHEPRECSANIAGKRHTICWQDVPVAVFAGAMEESSSVSEIFAFPTMREWDDRSSASAAAGLGGGGTAVGPDDAGFWDDILKILDLYYAPTRPPPLSIRSLKQNFTSPASPSSSKSAPLLRMGTSIIPYTSSVIAASDDLIIRAHPPLHSFLESVTVERIRRRGRLPQQPARIHAREPTSLSTLSGDTLTANGNDRNGTVAGDTSVTAQPPLPPPPPSSPSASTRSGGSASSVLDSIPVEKVEETDGHEVVGVKDKGKGRIDGGNKDELLDGGGGATAGSKERVRGIRRLMEVLQGKKGQKTGRRFGGELRSRNADCREVYGRMFALNRVRNAGKRDTKKLREQ
ncbi:hypothetical protein HK101_011924 [Irineochytrium annulatum]|nr:hypothetical protein HK101_011924 [Irineochytrium annulatum]